nr:putative capsid protein [Picobirnavirus sp.]
MTSNAINYKKARDDRDMREQELKETKRSNLVKEEADKLKAKAAWEKAKGSNIKDVTTAINSSTRQMFDAGTAIAGQINDFAWYTNYVDLELNTLKQAIQNYAGYDLQYDDSKVKYTSDTNNVETNMYKQSILAYKFQTTLGSASNYASPTALAIREFNTAVRKDNFSNQSYDSVDLFLYPLAFDAITYMLCWLLRGLALVNYADARDPSTIVYGLLKAHCYGNATLAETFVSDRTELIDLYNQIVVRLNALNVPIQLPYIKRHAFLALNVFTQGEGVGRSYFIMNPHSYYYYDEVNGVLQCKTVERKLQSGTAGTIRNLFNEMIIPLVNSQSIAIMSGDIDRAMGVSHPFSTIALSDMGNLRINLVDDPKYLMSIKNADIIHIKDDVGGELSDFDIKQGDDGNANPYLYQGATTGIPYQRPELELWDSVNNTTDTALFEENGGHVVDYYDSTKITEEDQCYNTSFKVVTGYDKILHCRSEIIVEEKYYTYAPNNRDIKLVGSRRSNFLAFEHSTADTYDIETIKDDFEYVLRLAQFKFVPKVFLFQYYTGENYMYMVWNGNKNRNFIDNETLGKIQDNTLLSMFAFTAGGSTNMGNTNSNSKSKSKANNKRK